MAFREHLRFLCRDPLASSTLYRRSSRLIYQAAQCHSRPEEQLGCSARSSHAARSRRVRMARHHFYRLEFGGASCAFRNRDGRTGEAPRQRGLNLTGRTWPLPTLLPSLRCLLILVGC